VDTTCRQEMDPLSDATFSTCSANCIGGRPRFTVRATRGSRPRMESRMLGNLHVRFGAGDEETCPGNGTRRFIPALLYRKSPSFLSSNDAGA
jgi:hypothetical protein